MNKIAMLEQLGADASLQTASARELFLQDTHLRDLEEEGKMWCLMLPEDDEDDEDGDDDGENKPGNDVNQAIQ